jgi:hypothetical protein
VAAGSLIVTAGGLVEHNKLINNANKDADTAYRTFSLAKYYSSASPDFVQQKMQQEADSLYRCAAYKKEQAGVCATVSVVSAIVFLWQIFSCASDEKPKEQNVKLNLLSNKIQLSCNF